MKLSVIVPVYNMEPYLSACLDSLLEQGLPDSDYEIICVDDGSTDQSAAILEAYAGRWRHITVIHQDNRGVSATRNTGLQAASGEYVYFIDSDDLLERNVLAPLYCLAAGNGLDMLLFDYAHFKDGTDVPIIGQAVDPGRLRLFQDPVKMRECSKVPAWQVVWNYLVRLSVLREYGLAFPEGVTVFEDAQFCFWLDRCASSCGYLDQKLYYYRQRENSAIHSFTSGEAFPKFIWGRVKLAGQHQARLQDYRAGVRPKLRVAISETELENRMIDEVQGILNRLLANGDRSLFEEVLCALTAQGTYPYPLRLSRLLRKKPLKQHFVDMVSFPLPLQGYLRLCAAIRRLFPSR